MGQKRERGRRRGRQGEGCVVSYPSPQGLVVNRPPSARRKKEKKEAKEKQLKAAAKKKAKLPQIAEGANPYINPNKPRSGAPLKEVEDDFMASLLGDLEGQATVKKTDSPRPAAAPVRRSKQSLVKTAVTSAKRQADMDASSFRSNDHFATSSDPLSSDPTFVGAPSSDPFDSGTKKARFDSSMDQFDDDDMGGMDTPDQDWEEFSALAAANKQNEDVKMEEDDEDDLLVKKPSNGAAKPKGPAQRRQLVNASAIRPGQSKREPVDEPSAPATPAFIDVKPKSKRVDWRTATSSLAFASAPISATEETTDDSTAFNKQHESVVGRGASREKTRNANALESDGSLRFWWFDYDEPAPGVVRLVGKVRVQGETVRVVSTADGKKVEKDVPKFVSATVLVKGIKRKLYVLPKTKAECAFKLSLPSLLPPRLILSFLRRLRRRGRRGRLRRRGRR